MKRVLEFYGGKKERKTKKKTLHKWLVGFEFIAAVEWAWFKSIHLGLRSYEFIYLWMFGRQEGSQKQLLLFRNI